MINALTDPRRVVRAGYGSTSGLSEAEIEIPRCKSGFASGEPKSAKTATASRRRASRESTSKIGASGTA
jgi:hypothetical protein